MEIINEINIINDRNNYRMIYPEEGNSPYEILKNARSRYLKGFNDQFENLNNKNLKIIVSHGYGVESIPYLYDQEANKYGII
jgi:hypothetical protein